MMTQSPLRHARPVIWTLLSLFIVGCGATAPTPTTPPESRPITQTPPESEPPAPTPRNAEETRKETPPEAKPFVHTVRWPGETLSLIAKWYTGRHSNWKTLAKANPELNPHRIFVGSKILIPHAILTTQKPMPRSVVVKKAPTRKQTRQPSKTGEGTSADAPPLPLFGPKGG